MQISDGSSHPPGLLCKYTVDSPLQGLHISDRHACGVEVGELAQQHAECRFVRPTPRQLRGFRSISQGSESKQRGALTASACPQRMDTRAPLFGFTSRDAGSSPAVVVIVFPRCLYVCASSSFPENRARHTLIGVRPGTTQSSCKQLTESVPHECRRAQPARRIQPVPLELLLLRIDADNRRVLALRRQQLLLLAPFLRAEARSRSEGVVVQSLCAVEVDRECGYGYALQAMPNFSALLAR